MTDPVFDLDVDRIERILAPFAGAADRVLITVVDAAGRTVAASSPSATPAPWTGTEVARDILCTGTTIGQLVATGPAAGDPTTIAALEAMAAGLGQLAEADLHRLASELAQGRQQQRSFVSLHAPDVPGYDLASHYEAAREIGGDWFELFQQPRPDRPIGVVIADVTGKGIAAGMLMAFARPVIHAALDAADGPADALERTNRILVEEIRSSLFITAIAGTLDVGSGRMRIANAGHELPMVIPGDGGAIQRVDGSGVLLGAFEALGVGEQDVYLQHGDILLLYTDGVTDATSATGERFGEARMLATIEATRRGSATDVVNALRDAVSEFRGSVPPADDITIVAIGRRAS